MTMFHYQKDIDAWRRHTRRLSAIEKGVYGELLDELYATESPLPNDQDELNRIAGCTKQEERNAVAKILKRFFELTDAGYVQARAFEEIAEYQSNAEKNRSNGKKGGRPPKKPNPEETQKETQTKTPGLFLGSENTPKNTDFENPNERQSGNPVIQSISVDIPESAESISPAQDPDPPAATPDQFKRFRMTTTWTPSPQVLDDCCRLVGFQRFQITPEVIGEFVSYFAGVATEQAEIQWCNKLVKSCQRMLAKGTHPDQLRIKSAGNGDFIARHNDRSWAEGL